MNPIYVIMLYAQFPDEPCQYFVQSINTIPIPVESEMDMLDIAVYASKKDALHNALDLAGSMFSDSCSVSIIKCQNIADVFDIANGHTFADIVETIICSASGKIKKVWSA